MNAQPAKLTIGYSTHEGQVRERNEDYGSYQETIGGHLFVVADGVGGENYGDVASHMAVDNILKLYPAYYKENQQKGTGKSIQDLLRDVLIQTNFIVFDEAQRRGTVGHMGTTVVVAVLMNNRLDLAWIGDSRIYAIRHNKPHVKQLTQDHTQVEERVRAGQLTPEQAQVHPDRNVLSRSLGGDEHIDPETAGGTLGEGDYILLCSDGLTRYANEQTLAEHVLKAPPQQATESLLKYAYDRGGKDNITVMVVQHGDLQEPEKLTVLDSQPAPVAAASTNGKSTSVVKAASTTGGLLSWIPRDNITYMLGGVAAAIAVVILMTFLILSGGDDGVDASTEMTADSIAMMAMEETDVANTATASSPTPTATASATITNTPTVEETEEAQAGTATSTRRPPPTATPIGSIQPSIEFNEGDQVFAIRDADLFGVVGNPASDTIPFRTLLMIRSNGADANPFTGADGLQYYHVDGNGYVGWVWAGDLELFTDDTQDTTTVITPQSDPPDNNPGDVNGGSPGGDPGNNNGNPGGGGDPNPQPTVVPQPTEPPPPTDPPPPPTDEPPPPTPTPDSRG